MDTFLVVAGVALLILVIWAGNRNKNLAVKQEVAASPPPNVGKNNNIPKPPPERTYGNVEEEFEDYESFELTGIHIPSRKKYILHNCSELDCVSFFRDHKNSVDKNAIGVKHEGKLIGYIGEDDVPEVQNILLGKHQAYIEEIDSDGSFLEVYLGLEYTLPPVQPKGRRKKLKVTGAAANPDHFIGQDEIIKFNMNKISKEHLSPKKDLEDTGSFFYGKKVCISGEMDNFPVRPELAAHLWNLGADIDTSVGKKCNILICGSGVGPTKVKTAKAYGVYMMYEEELLEKLDGFKSKYV